ncbi:MAG: trypsin-like serine protease [Pseudomonadota bacterium]
MQRFIQVLAIAGFFLCGPASAQGLFENRATKLQSLNSLDASKTWRGVGRINLGGIGFCTGTLIADDLVLTAAHCFFNKRTGKRIESSKVEFLAGLRSGRASAYRNVRRVILHPEYVYDGAQTYERYATDLALIELDRAIRDKAISPFETSQRGYFGQEVQVVSYAKDREDAPSIQETCHVIANKTSVFVTSCDVDFGASGAPIFAIEDGIPRIMSVVSAKAEWQSKKVSIAAGLEDHLGTLLALLETSDGVFQRQRQPARKLTLGQARSQTGALFVRP